MLSGARQQLRWASSDRKPSASPTGSPRHTRLSRRAWRAPWRSEPGNDLQDLDWESAVDAVQDHVLELGDRMAAGDFESATRLLEDLAGRSHHDDQGLHQLALLMKEVVSLFSAYHNQDLSSWTCSRVGSCHSSPGFRKDSTGSAGTWREAGEGSFEAPALAVEVRRLREQLMRLPDAKTASKQLILRAATAADLLVELLFNISSTVWAPLLHSQENFVSARALVQRLRSIHRSLATTATSSLLAAPLSRLMIEAELLEALVTSEYKASLVKAGDAFVELVRGEQLLARYLGGSRTSEVKGHALSSVSATSGGAVSAASEEAAESYISAASAPPRVMGGGSPTAASTVGCADGAETELSRLERWLVQFHAHCAGKLVLLCGGGLMAAARFSARQVLDPQSSAEQAKALTAGYSAAASAGAQAGSSSMGPSGSPGPRDQTCNYLQDLRRLAATPGVTFAGVFANVRQLPHLPSDASRGSSGASLAVPLQDSAWLLPGQRNGAGNATGAVGECEWWALAFATNLESANAASTTIGLQALEACRHLPELRSLRAALGDACHERHSASRAFASADRDPATMSPTLTASTFTGPSSFLVQPRQLHSSHSSSPLSPSLPPNVSPPSLPSHIRDVRRGKYASLSSERKHGFGGSQPDLSAVELASSSLPPFVDSIESCLVTSRLVNAPSKPSSVNVEVEHAAASFAAAGAEHGAKCLILPLDLSWFPSPLFLGVSFSEPKSATGSVGNSPALGEASSRRRAKQAAPRVQQSAAAEAQDEQRGLFARLGKWWKGDSISTTGQEDLLAVVEREMMALASAASGRSLRSQGGRVGDVSAGDG